MPAYFRQRPSERHQQRDHQRHQRPGAYRQRHRHAGRPGRSATREGVYFIPPALVQQVVDNADVIHIHDEWTRKKFDEGKYKSSEIYGSPKDPALKKEYEDYLKKRLEEIRKNYK